MPAYAIIVLYDDRLHPLMSLSEINLWGYCMPMLMQKAL